MHMYNLTPTTEVLHGATAFEQTVCTYGFSFRSGKMFPRRIYLARMVQAHIYSTYREATYGGQAILLFPPKLIVIVHR